MGLRKRDIQNVVWEPHRGRLQNTRDVPSSFPERGAHAPHDGYHASMSEDSSYHPDVVDSKAARPGYAPAAFYFKQTVESGRVRWVAWARNATGTRAVFTALLRLMPDEVEVLLKLDWEDTPDGPVFTRYHGYA